MARNDNPTAAELRLALARHTQRRPARPREWSGAKIVTFIVTLAGHRNVTLAAYQAGMSRKSAYALKDRDPAFASAWAAALGAHKADAA